MIGILRKEHIVAKPGFNRWKVPPASIAAYLADLFGTRYMGAIYGRLLTAWGTAGVLGPLAITSLRDHSRLGAIADLASKVTPEAFKAKFGADLSQLEMWVKQKTVTISKLMEIAPEGTLDPSANLYNTTMYLMAGLLAIALVANALIRPVNPVHYMKED
jgi:hypothetical protein